MHQNPYDPPQVACTLPEDFIDRVQRERLALEIRYFLERKSTAFEDDEVVLKFRTSQDKTIQFVMGQLALVYEEFPDPHSKQAWDYVQRLLLLLESNRTVEVQNQYRWRASQLVAGVSLVLYFYLPVFLDYCGWQLLFLSLPFSIVAYGITATYEPLSRSPYHAILYPFTSFTELKAVYDSARGFRKQRFRRNKSKTDASSLPVAGLCIALFCIFSPIVLLFYTFPTMEKNVRIIEPQQR